MHCSPSILKENDKPLINSCLSLSKLYKIANNYNKTYDDKIIYGNMDKNELYNTIKKKLSNKCGNNEVCWITQPFIKKSKDKTLLKYTFRPFKPKGNKYQWLSTTNLDDVMEQYTKYYTNFHFFGAVPIDFYNLTPSLYKINFEQKYKEGINCYGLIINTDPSYKSGEHWMSLFIDLKPNNPSINFYDSVAQCPAPKEIMIFIKYILKFENKLQKLWNNNNKIKINCNNVQHQRKNSECGTYSLYYITESLKGKTFEEISNNIIKDEEMNNKRNIFFSSPNKIIN